MYPSAQHPAYGIFVANHVARMTQQHGVSFQMAVSHHQPRSLRERVSKYSLAPWVVARAAQKPADLAHLHYLSAAHAPAAFPALLKSNLPLVVTLHGGDVSSPPLWGLRKKLVQQILGRAAAVIAVSGWVKQIALGLGVAEERLHVISMGCDLDVFQYVPPTEKEAAKQRLGLGPGPMVLCVGDLIPRKGVDLLLGALAGISAHLVLAGAGPERQKLEQQANRLGIQTTWLGAVPHAVLSGWYAAADVFVFPTRDEPLGLVTLEAMASGTPVLATRVGGVPELVVDQENGLLVATENVAALQQGLLRLLGDPVLRAKLALAGQKTAQAHGLDRQVERVLDVYRQVLSGNPRSARGAARRSRTRGHSGLG